MYMLVFFLLAITVKAQDQEQKTSGSVNGAIEELIKKETDRQRKIQLAHQYTTAIKKDNDPIALADTYLFLTEAFTHSKRAVAYADSIIQVTKDLKDNTIYPAEGYLQKGIQLYYTADYDRALENYLIADNYYKNQENFFKQLVIRHYVGILKNNTNEFNEAFLIFKENIKFFEEEKNKKRYKKQYLKSLYALANGFILLEKLDSAEHYSRLGLKASIDSDKYLYPHFLLAFSGTKILQKKYKTALDSLLKCEKVIPDNKKISLCRNYQRISYVYDSLNIEDKSLKYLYKIDSVYQKEPQVILQAETAYQILLKKYQNKGNKDKQLEIIEKLLVVDSIIKRRPKNLSRKIVEQYETPKLLGQKEKLIKELEEDQSLSNTTISILGLFSLALVLGVFYFARKNIVNKKRYQALIAQQPKDIQESKIEVEVAPETKEVIKKATDLPEDLVNTILERLAHFEASKKFINKQYTLSSLAKELNTNSAYLSKIINAEKQTSFAHYINKLRVDYAVAKLKEDSVLRSYTIKAIASEFGFNTAQSFSNAFYKQTGIYPSFFIKQLEKNTGNQ